MIVKRFGGSEYKVRMDFVTSDGRRFFIRIYDDSIKKEFLEISELLKKRGSNVKISPTYIDGTYEVREIGISMEYSMWDILMHKYLSLSRDVRKDCATGEKYYPIRFSDSVIGYCDRPMAV